MKPENEIRVALAGNPNSGKSTIFNELTGARQTIGNFPGVTVERYEGRTQYDGYKITIIDLPGVYSLSSFSDEERVAAEYLTQSGPDLIVNIVDASHLERNLYLTLLLRELKKPMFVVLNMSDVAKRRGIEIDVSAMSKELGVPVLNAIGNRGIGIKEILVQIVDLTKHKDDSSLAFSNERWEKISETVRHDSKDISFDCSEQSCSKGNCCGKCQSGIAWQTAMDVARYKEINRICIRSVRSMIPLEGNRSDRIDGVLTNKYLGIPIFLLAMYLVFQLTFLIGQYPMDWIENGFGFLADYIRTYWPEGNGEFLKSLLIDGVIGGVGGVLVFLPNIFFLFLAISLLEDSGYMARAALLCDRWMHKIGLHGRSVVPMLIGFGCTVPALMATKMLTNRKERLATMFVLPLFSCGARFPIYAMLIPAFFPLQWQGPILWSLYLIGILLSICIAKIMTCFFPKEEDVPFIIELPPYHFPTFRTVGIRTLERVWQYVKKAGTIILGISIALWFLTNYPDLPTDQKAMFEQQRSFFVQEIERHENSQNIQGAEILTRSHLDESDNSVHSEKNDNLNNVNDLSNETLSPLSDLNSSPLNQSDEDQKSFREIQNEEFLKTQWAELDNQETQSRLSNSYAGQLGRFMEPILRPMGFDWKIGTALIGAVAAKEVFVAQMGIIYSTDKTESYQTKNFPSENSKIENGKPSDNQSTYLEAAPQDSEGLADILSRTYSPLTAFCIMLFCLIASPCMATFVMMAKESGSWKWAFAQWIFLTGTAWLLTTLTYQVLTLFGLK